MPGKLSDSILLDPQATQYLADFLAHIKNEIMKYAKKDCLRRDEILITRDDMQDACASVVKITDQDDPYTSQRGD
jgi:hypothetical protein